MFHFAKILPSFFIDLVYLVYPNICQSCEKQLVEGEKIVCLYCQFRLPQTHFHRDPENPVAKLFWGRVQIEKATAFYYYTKGGKVQKLIYRLKYQGRKEIGIRLGQLFGGALKEDCIFEDIDLILPVPLHFSKERKRGFNQCDLIAEGLSRVLKIPWSGKLLERKMANVSQTGKNRMGRWENVENIFRVKNKSKLLGKKVLLIDDVVTTGSTLEACAEAILKVPGTTVCIATIATAR